MSDLSVPIRYDAWATDQLLEACAKLGPDQQALTTPGTMGTIRATLTHLVAAKERYWRLLSGEEIPADGIQEDREPELPAVLARHRVLAEKYERFGSGAIDLGRKVERRGPQGVSLVDVATIVTQLIHHGNEHRAHVGSILGAHGLEIPHYSAWAWGLVKDRP